MGQSQIGNQQNQLSSRAKHLSLLQADNTYMGLQPAGLAHCENSYMDDTKQYAYLQIHTFNAAGASLGSIPQPQTGVALCLAWLNASKSYIFATIALALCAYAVFFPHPERGPREIAAEIMPSQALVSDIKGEPRDLPQWMELHKQYVEEIKHKVAEKEVSDHTSSFLDCCMAIAACVVSGKVLDLCQANKEHPGMPHNGNSIEGSGVTHHITERCCDTMQAGRQAAILGGMHRPKIMPICLQTLDIIFYGDSITESFRGLQVGVPVEKFKGIPAVYAKSYGGVNAAVYSISGTGSQLLLINLNQQALIGYRSPLPFLLAKRLTSLFCLSIL